ncbi:phosphatase PAP2 family protein [Halovivax gelatinilyticus]|uniref:phosphatase PAP2 family protein n=1 Tax=Halovivax gelatinilyticus TaxID=2961597 RepID=UPI0020CA72D4|nr:phosphatase PAP2 family protein [Halovivax gelatinilyticus]
MLVSILSRVAVVVAFLLVISVPTIIGIDRLKAALIDWRARVRAAIPIALVLIPVLLINSVSRQELVSFSEEYGVRAGGWFYYVEGEFILVFQEFANTPITQYFSFIYIYAYVFLLVFPVIAYFTLRETKTLRMLLAAYTLNYTIGAILYVAFHAFGPRQYLGVEVEHMLYDFQPAYQTLTSEVNDYTNVFPSLHTSLSATVMIYALRTRAEFPLWAPIASIIAVSVWISTMYLGIHWAIDVVAGLALAVSCVAMADWLIDSGTSARLVEPITARVEPLYDRIDGADPSSRDRNS